MWGRNHQAEERVRADEATNAQAVLGTETAEDSLRGVQRWEGLRERGELPRDPPGLKRLRFSHLRSGRNGHSNHRGQGAPRCFCPQPLSCEAASVRPCVTGSEPAQGGGLLLRAPTQPPLRGTEGKACKAARSCFLGGRLHLWTSLA